MQRDDYLKDYYKTLEEAPLDVLEEYEGNTIAAIDHTVDEKEIKELKKDLKRVRVLMAKRRAK